MAIPADPGRQGRFQKAGRNGGRIGVGLSVTYWFNMSVLWLTLEYIGILIPFESSCIVLLLNAFDRQSTFTNILYSALSMVFVVLVYAINPHKHVKGYRKAYEIIEDAINRHTEADNNELCNALRCAENYINMAFDIDNKE